MRKGIILALAFILVSCGGQKKKSDDTITRGAARNSGFLGAGKLSDTAIQTFNGSVWGILTPQSNNATRAFLSTDWPYDFIGATTNQSDSGWTPASGLTPRSCSPGICEARLMFGIETGSNQHAYMTTQSNQLISQIIASSRREAVTAGGITLAFWDSLVGTTMDGEVLTAIPVYVPIDPQGSYIQGSQINMVFKDSKGSITVTGIVEPNGLYHGTVSFQNTVNVNNQQAAAGLLGNFDIHICSVFKCN
ncbi:MAG: hypothetical protein IPM57_06790 [Oligoflexia bacterium]|nr:hypothetical protein [Oligoflexia bacterium]